MNNKLEITKNGKKEYYDILLSVDTKENKKYILYTNGEKNDIDEIIVYAGELIEKKKGIAIEPIMDDDLLEYLDSILLQVQKNSKKEVEK